MFKSSFTIQKCYPDNALKSLSEEMNILFFSEYNYYVCRTCVFQRNSVDAPRSIINETTIKACVLVLVAFLVDMY